MPDKGYDAILFAGVALVAACVLQGKFSALWLLLAGDLAPVLAAAAVQVQSRSCCCLQAVPARLFLSPSILAGSTTH